MRSSIQGGLDNDYKALRFQGYILLKLENCSNI